MTKSKLNVATAGTAAAIIVLAGGTAVSAGQGTAIVRLQSSSPGTTQAGHLNINGTGLVRRLEATEPTFANAVLGLSNGATAASLHPGGSYWPAAGEFAGPNGIIAGTSTTGGYGVLGLADGISGYAGVFQHRGTSGAAILAETTSTSAWAMTAIGGLGARVDRLSIGTTESTYPLQFSTGLGDKISLWGAGTNSYGFGIQGSLLQVHTDVAGSDVAFGYGSSAAFTETMRVKGNGNVGIGVNPTNKLQVAGRTVTTNFSMTSGAASNTVLLGDNTGASFWGTVGNANLTSDGGSLFKVTGGVFAMSGTSMQGNSSSSFSLSDPAVVKVNAFPNTILGGGVLRVYGPNGNHNAVMSFLNGFPNNGYVLAADAAGAQQAGIYVSSAGAGIVFGDTKSFLVPDPDDDSKNIMYACIEGPEAAMYTRGTSRLVNGEAHIDLPDHFRKLASAQGITVVLTPKSRGSLGLGFENESPSSFDVFELNNGKGTYEFAWEIKAVRKGHENWQAERPWDEALPGGDKKQQWEARLKSLSARRQQVKP